MRMSQQREKLKIQRSVRLTDGGWLPQRQEGKSRARRKQDHLLKVKKDATE